MDAILNKLEILFWDRVTPALSESPVMQLLVKKGYLILHEKNIESTILWAIGTGILGLLSGIVLSILSAAS